MAELKNRIIADVKTAMRARNKPRLAALRLIQAALKQKEVDERVELDDSQVLAILGKLTGQHRDSMEQFAAGGRTDLVDKEKFELGVIQEFLPDPLSEQAIDDLIDSALAQSGAQSIKDMGKVMAQLKSAMQGRADMGKVSSIVKQRLSG